MLPEVLCSEDAETDSSADSFVVNGTAGCIGHMDHIDICVSSTSKTVRVSQSGDRHQITDDVPIRRLALVRRSAADCIVNDTIDYRLQSLVIMQDDSLTDFTVARVLMRVCYSLLTSLYLVDCPLLQLGDETVEMMTSLPLRSLVLSRTPQRRLPPAVFRLRSLEVLKVDRNWLAAVPHEIGQLSRLRVFSCDGQRPHGLQSLPAAAMRSLTRLQVLSIANNCIETLEPWIGALSQLRVLRACHNHLRHLPSSLTELNRLAVVDVRRNRRLQLDSSLSGLVSRLERFDIDDHSTTVGRSLASNCVGDELAAELDLSRYRRDAVEQASPSGVVRDITIAVVGATCAGKATLIEALCSQRGVCSRPPPHHTDMATNKHTSGSFRPVSGLDFRHFETKSTDDDVVTCSVSAFVVSNDHAFNYVRQFHVDLYVLAFDLMSFESSPRGGASSTSGNSFLQQQQQRQRQQSVTRCAARLRLWLRALADAAPDVPVLLVGTRAAELGRVSAAGTGVSGDVWRSIYDAILRSGRAEHTRCYTSRSPNCLLCSSTDLSYSRRTFGKSRHNSASGFVDLSNQHNSNDKVLINGHVPSMTSHDNDDGDDITVCDVTSVCRRYNFRSSLPTWSCQTTPDCGQGLPHVVAYYEIESMKPFPKDFRRGGSGNLAVEQLRAAIVRLTKGGDAVEGENIESTRVPLSWWRFARHLATVAETDPTQPCLPFYDVIAIGRSFDVAPRSARHALRHYARRGRVWIGDAVRRNSTSLVIVYPPWIVETVGRVLDTVDSSVVAEQDLLRRLNDKDVERQLAKAAGSETVTSLSSSRWLLAVLENIGVCAPLASCRAFIFPVLLETGNPNDDVWAESPEWNEKQVTCEIPIRRARPGQFAALQVKIGGPQGLQHFAVMQHPAPKFLRHHVVFATAYDTGPCEDCFRFNRRCRPGSDAVIGLQQRSSAVVDNFLYRSGTGLVDVSLMPPAATEEVDSSVASSAAIPSSIMHRVRITLDCRVTCISVQVRGSNPCCVMRAIVDFIDGYLDDDVASPTTNLSSGGVDTCSMKTTDRCLITNGTTSSVASSKSAWRSRASTISAYRASYCGSRDSVSADTSIRDNDDESGVDSDAVNTFVSHGNRRRVYVVCPKCILMRNPRPERIEYPWAFSGSASASSTLRRRRPICSKWHNLGSWARVITGDYRVTAIGLDVAVPGLAASPATGGGGETRSLSDLDHPRMVVVLPSSVQHASVDWYTVCQTQFLEGYEARFLCEYTGYWHVVDDATYRFSTGAAMTLSTGVCRRRRPGDQLLAGVLSLALPVVQCLNAVDEHPENARLLAPVITELIEGYDFLVAVDGHHQFDPCAWLVRHKDRIVSVLTKMLVSASEGVVDIHSKTSRPMAAEAVFQTPAGPSVGRTALARYLCFDSTAGRFGCLRPVIVGREIRWVCQTHYDELSAVPPAK